MPESTRNDAHEDPAGDPPRDATDTHLSATFCFVDIAGYTALTDSHGEHAAADLVDEFTQLIRATVVAPGQVQELSGDAAFLVFPDPISAVMAVSRLYREVAGIRDFPALRTGLHHGPALYRANRYFGTTINLAARTAAQAGGGEILCTAPVAEFLSKAPDARLRIDPIGKVRLKNIPQDVELFSLTPGDMARRRAVDPVCQMQVDEKTAASSFLYDGRRYWFCSADCAKRFTNSPTDFL